MPTRRPGRQRASTVRFRRRARRFRADVPSPSELARRSGSWWGLARDIVTWLRAGFVRSRANDLAAAIAYYALLSIVPIILGLVSLVGLVLRTDEGFRQAVELVSWVVPDELLGNSLATLPRLRDQSGTFGIVSLVGFLWVGATFFAALGRAMNQVYEVPDRPLLHQRVRGLVGIVTFAVLFTASVIAAVVPTAVLGIDETSLPLGLERWPIFSGLFQALAYVAAVLMAILMFGVIFRLVPAAGQRVGDVVPGAVAIGLAFVLIVQVFPVYLRIVRDWNLIGGTAGLLSLVLLWCYLLGHLFLFGAYINATWQRHRRQASVHRQ
jgi:membrane protein